MKGLSKFDLREFNKIIGFGEFYSIRLLFHLLLSNRADNICQQIWTIVLEIVWDFFLMFLILSLFDWLTDLTELLCKFTQCCPIYSNVVL